MGVSMVTLVLELAKEFHINPISLIGAILVLYTFLGFAKYNKESHKQKDEKIEELEKKIEKLKNEKLENKLKQGLTNNYMEGLK